MPSVIDSLENLKALILRDFTAFILEDLNASIPYKTLIHGLSKTLIL